MAAQDSNQARVAYGAYNGSPVALKAEHSTGYLKAKIYNTSLTPPSVTPTVAGRDSNSVTSSLASYNGSPKPLMVTHSGGYLRAVNN